jgi:hypothetical protein
VLLLDAVNEEDDEQSDILEEKFTNFDPVVRIDLDLNITA